MEENNDTDVKKCEFLAQAYHNHEMYVKKEVEDDLLALYRSADTYVGKESLSQIKSESVDSSTHNLTAEVKDENSPVREAKCESEMKMEFDDSSYNLTSNVKYEESPVPITFHVLKAESEEGFCNEHTKKEEINLKEASGQNEVLTGSPAYYLQMAGLFPILKLRTTSEGYTLHDVYLRRVMTYTKIKLESVDCSRDLTAEVNDEKLPVPDTIRGLKCESEMKVEFEDTSYNLTSDVKCEENPVLITCRVLGEESEEGFCIERTEKEQTNLKEATEKDGVITGRRMHS
ncbi:uncharacterized protein [Periplaneta americana]|uniref:uncharacterized protein isoform X5 n=1 Tax=Periplaneta americana TaxID=6978 RepID=UPI0037E91679